HPRRDERYGDGAGAERDVLDAVGGAAARGAGGVPEPVAALRPPRPGRAHPPRTVRMGPPSLPASPRCPHAHARPIPRGAGPPRRPRPPRDARGDQGALRRPLRPPPPLPRPYPRPPRDGADDARARPRPPPRRPPPGGGGFG